MEIKTYNFVGIDATQAKGIEEVKEHTGIGIAPCGLTVEVKKEGVGIHLVPADGKIQITYGRDFEFYRALSQLNYVAESGRAIHETTFMSDLCFMADMSRNAVYNLPAAKKMIRYLALAGYSSLMFYTEDTFTVDEYKYFGHMRGRFSKEELRELDDYAFGFGIEVIPCVQTLAHLACALKWPEISAYLSAAFLTSASMVTTGFTRAVIAAIGPEILPLPSWMVVNLIFVPAMLS